MIAPYQGQHPRIGNRAFIAPLATVIGRVELGEDASIWFQCVVRADVNTIHIGARVNIQDASCLHVASDRPPLVIEDEVSVAHKVMLHGCTIRKGALIGMSSTILDGADIGEGCLVAAGSLVREGFTAPTGTLVAGWPAVVKGELTPAQRGRVDGLWARYVRQKDLYLAESWISPA